MAERQLAASDYRPADTLQVRKLCLHLTELRDVS